MRARLTDPFVIGHRGAPGYLPEHTRGSFELAITQGVDAVEVDVVASKDGVPVVRHERELSATTDVAGRREFAERRRHGSVDGRTRNGWFAEDFTWAELSTLRARERVPAIRPLSAVHDGEEGLLKLSDVASLAAAGGVGLVVELKEASRSASLGLPLPELIAADLADAPASLEVVIESFEKAPLLEFAAGGFSWPLVYLLEASGIAADEALLGARGRDYRAEMADPAGLAAFAAVSVPTTLVGPANVDRLHDAGLGVWTWTLRPENRFLPSGFRRGSTPSRLGDWHGHWSALFAAGVDGVFADHPDLAVVARSAATEPVPVP